jgi:hypothetical protein
MPNAGTAILSGEREDSARCRTLLNAPGQADLGPEGRHPPEPGNPTLGNVTLAGVDQKQLLGNGLAPFIAQRRGADIVGRGRAGQLAVDAGRNGSEFPAEGMLPQPLLLAAMAQSVRIKQDWLQVHRSSRMTKRSISGL